MPENLGGFFTFIGTAAAIGYVLTWLAGNSTWFEKQNSQAKALVLIIVALLMGFASRVLVTYVPANITAGLEPWYETAVSSIAILIASQAWHDRIHKDGTPAAVGIKAAAGGNA